MNDIQKFKFEVEKVIDDIDTVIHILENASSAYPDDTINDVVELYEDTSERLKKAFDELGKNIGSKLITDLKAYGKEITTSESHTVSRLYKMR